MEENLFESLRKELYSEILLSEETAFDKNFRNKFYKLLEYCTLTLMKGKDNFFALFFIRMKRDIRVDVTTAAVTIISGNNFVIYFNPMIFLELNLKEMQAIIKHEIYHIMSRHYERAAALKNSCSELAISLAMDISINQYIMYLPAWAEKLENVKLAYNVDLKEEQSMEVYAKSIQEALDKLKVNNYNKQMTNNILTDKEQSLGNGIKREHTAITAHEFWNKMSEDLDTTQLNELIVKTAKDSSKGSIPECVEKLMKAFDRTPVITWESYLKRFLGTLPAGQKKTITRRNRRQPERLDLRGTLSNRKADFIIAIDISGSISDNEIMQMMTEVFSIVKNYPYEITIIECDDQIRRLYKVKSIKEIKQKVDTKGGTKFSPVFEYIKKKKLRNNILIYFTDGEGERNLSTIPINQQILWVLTGKEGGISLENPYGSVIRLKNATEGKEVINVYEYINNELKDIRGEWAK